MSWHLIIDADDTLWENNIYFEDAFDHFVAFLGHSTLTAADIREELNVIETENAKHHGYGSVNFGRNMVECLNKLATRPITARDEETVREFAHVILDHPMVILPGVEQTLGYLSAKYELTLFTKGSVAEQEKKVARSNLAHYFAHVEVTKEKHREAYLDLLQMRQMERARAWMIGNSPKSDINPALAAGLNAAYVPHARTWVLEREELRPGTGRLLVLENFAGLQEHF